VKYYFGDAYHVESLDFAYVTMFSLLAGAIYYQVNLQGLALYPSRRFVNTNILKKLILIYGKHITPSQKVYLESDRRYMHVSVKVISQGKLHDCTDHFALLSSFQNDRSELMHILRLGASPKQLQRSILTGESDRKWTKPDNDPRSAALV